MSHKNRNRRQTHQPPRGVVRNLEPKRPTAMVDILVPVYGEWALAEKAVASLPKACDGLWEGYRVIVVDNGTPAWQDNQGAIINPAEQAIGLRKLLRPQDAFFRLEKNAGYPGGLNFAASKGSSPLLLIVTADVELTPRAATVLVRKMDDPTIGVVGPLLLFPEGSQNGPAERVQHAGMAFDIRGRPFHQFLGWTPDHPKVAKESEVAAITGACFITRRAIWKELGGLFPGYGAGTFEDIDFCFGARALGHRVVYTPDARGYHAVGGSIAAGTQRGFNLTVNETIFKGRWATMLAWDEWRRW